MTGKTLGAPAPSEIVALDALIDAVAARPRALGPEGADEYERQLREARGVVS